MVSVWGDVMSGFEGSHGTPQLLRSMSTSPVLPRALVALPSEA